MPPPRSQRRSRAFAVRPFTSSRRYIDVDPRKIGGQTRGAPIEAPSRADRRDGFILAAVGAPGGREEIEAALADRGLQPWRDYLAVA
jgi:hypothetical protein